MVCFWCKNDVFFIFNFEPNNTFQSSWQFSQFFVLMLPKPCVGLSSLRRKLKKWLKMFLSFVSKPKWGLKKILGIPLSFLSNVGYSKHYKPWVPSKKKDVVLFANGTLLDTHRCKFPFPRNLNNALTKLYNQCIYN